MYERKQYIKTWNVTLIVLKMNIILSIFYLYITHFNRNNISINTIFKYVIYI